MPGQQPEMCPTAINAEPHLVRLQRIDPDLANRYRGCLLGGVVGSAPVFAAAECNR